MRIDVVSIFPGYFDALDLSLTGKARRSGLLDVRVHDLRTWTHDRHRTVDDTPYGGGAGMVMRPGPWGEALDEVTGSTTGPTTGTNAAPDADPGATVRDPLLVVPTPSGERFTQRVAEELAGRDWLVFACGRYEGIDARVVEHAATRMEVRELSVGDYVLNGGEVATLAVIESVVRLLPGFMGNPESLTEESHGTERLLEYPVYTKPPSWRGLDVPPVLLAGDHARIAAWRREQAVRRTAGRRPDLLHPSQRLAVTGAPDEEAEVRSAEPADVPEVLTLHRACLVQDAAAAGTWALPPVGEQTADLLASLSRSTTVVVRAGGRLVGFGRARADRGVWLVDRLLVVPDLQHGALASWLLGHLESAAPQDAEGYAVVTGSGSDLRALRKAGYRPTAHDRPHQVRLTKRRARG